MLALGDIPEVESHRLSELCRILNALEGLFVEDHNQVRMFQVIMAHLIFIQPSFVLAYVPSWLKFSYLSELLVSAITFFPAQCLR
jgi:centromere/kinetochore protein ZW10